MSLSTKQKITTNQANISTLQSEVANLTSNVAAAVAFHNVLVENEDITGLIQRIDTNLGSINTLNTQTSEQASTISLLQGQISSNDSEITSITQGFHADIAAVNSRVDQEVLDRNAAIQVEATARSDEDAALDAKISLKRTL